MGTRELLILILGLAVIAVILRGLYVAIHARRRQIRLAIDKNIPQDVDLEELEMAELPSGGARVVKRSLDRVNLQNSLQNELDLGAETDSQEAVPILLDSVELRKARKPEPKPQVSARKASGMAPARSAAEAASDSYAARPATASKQRVEQRPVQSHLAGLEDESTSEQSWMDEAAEDALRQAPEAEEPADLERAYQAAEAMDDEDYASAETDLTDDDTDLLAIDEGYADPLGEDDADDLSGELDPQGRREPQLALDEEADDEFSEFSISPEDRIGAPEISSASRSTSAGSDPRRSDNRKSLLSRFSRKDESYDRSMRTREIAVLEDDDDPLFARADSSAAASRALHQEPMSEQSIKPTQSGQRVTAAQQTAPEDRLATGKAPEAAGVTDFNQARESRRAAPASQSRATLSQPAERTEFVPSEVLVVNVMSRDGEMFRGSALLQVLTSAGLKHGDMNIFHRHLGNDSRGPIVFSVANILNPGTFDLQAMSSFRTPGVSLFLAMPAVISNREAFEDMLRTAQQLRSALDGELRDDRRSVMTAQTIEHYRQRIQDFELRKLKAAQAQS